MSKVEATFCRSAFWRRFARRFVVPWALDGQQLDGEGLEIGAGSGVMAEQLLSLQPDVKLTLVDVDPKMSRASAGRLRRFGDRADSAVGDAANLHYVDRSFDFVVSWLMLHHTIEWPAVIAESRRVLRPGGSFIGYDLVDTAPARFVHKYDGSEHRFFSAAELEDELARHYDRVETTVGVGGLVCRFSARVGPAEGRTLRNLSPADGVAT